MEGGTFLKVNCERLLKKRPREDEEVYAARMDHLTYQNILGTGLGWYIAAMFETPPEFFFSASSKGSDDNGKHDKFYDRFLENCDGVGTNYIDFWKKGFQFLLNYGCAWILTDLKQLEEGEEPPKSLEDERSRGLLNPHLAAYTPLNVINWKTDERGELRWAVIRTEEVQQEFLQKREIVTRWYYFDRENYRIFEDRRRMEDPRITIVDSNRRATLLKVGRHALADVGRVPLRRAILTSGLWLANRAYLLLLDHLNQDNTLKWALFMSNLAIPIIIGDGDNSNMTYTETGYLQFPEGTKYQWSEPEGKSFVHSAKRVESLREECFRSMHLQAQGRSMRATPAMQSGRSKILEMAPAKQILAGMGDDLRRHMQDVLKDVRDARRDKPDEVDPDVRGFKFQDDMTTEEVFSVTSLLSLRIPSERFEKYIYKKVAKAWMSDANRGEIEEVYEEIEEGPTMDERDKEEFNNKVREARAQITGAIAPKPGQLPPGRGGAGPSPREVSKVSKQKPKEK
jgi:hypothetical protein